MEQRVHSIGALLGGVFALADSGFDGVNQVMGLLIALIAAILMPGWRALAASALGAALVHVAIGVLRPVLDGGALVLPDFMNLTFWLTIVALFLGYAIVIAVFYFIRTLLTGSAFRRHRPAH